MFRRLRVSGRGGYCGFRGFDEVSKVYQEVVGGQPHRVFDEDSDRTLALLYPLKGDDITLELKKGVLGERKKGVVSVDGVGFLGFLMELGEEGWDWGLEETREKLT